MYDDDALDLHDDALLDPDLDLLDDLDEDGNPIIPTKGLDDEEVEDFL